MTSTSNTCLDVFGPADVFYFANYLADRDGLAAVPYRVELAARRVGPVRTSAGPALRAQWSVTDPHLRPDLLLVAGGLTVQDVTDDAEFVGALGRLAARSDEVGSTCTGAALGGSLLDAPTPPSLSPPASRNGHGRPAGDRWHRPRPARAHRRPPGQRPERERVGRPGRDGTTVVPAAVLTRGGDERRCLRRAGAHRGCPATAGTHRRWHRTRRTPVRLPHCGDVPPVVSSPHRSDPRPIPGKVPRSEQPGDAEGQGEELSEPATVRR